MMELRDQWNCSPVEHLSLVNMISANVGGLIHSIQMDLRECILGLCSPRWCKSEDQPCPRPVIGTPPVRPWQEQLAFLNHDGLQFVKLHVEVLAEIHLYRMKQSTNVGRYHIHLWGTEALITQLFGNPFQTTRFGPFNVASNFWSIGSTLVSASYPGPGDSTLISNFMVLAT